MLQKRLKSNSKIEQQNSYEWIMSFCIYLTHCFHPPPNSWHLFAYFLLNKGPTFTHNHPPNSPGPHLVFAPHFLNAMFDDVGHLYHPTNQPTNPTNLAQIKKSFEHALNWFFFDDRIWPSWKLNIGNAASLNGFFQYLPTSKAKAGSQPQFASPPNAQRFDVCFWFFKSKRLIRLGGVGNGTGFCQGLENSFGVSLNGSSKINWRIPH